ncbi:MAG: hypothetical protein JWO10_1653 [Microbacteriaceae bacterium]|nr:hypothetical protein [Microbacteriaceae bacterium]
MYSVGFALMAAGVKSSRSAATVVVAVLLLFITVIMSVTVTDITPVFRDFATTLAVPIAAWAGLFTAEMIIRRRRFAAESLLNRGGVYPDVNWLNLVMLVVASVVGFGLTSATVTWLGWQGYLFSLFGVPLSGDLAGTDIGVLVALGIGLLTPLVAGVPTVRRQEQVQTQLQG